MPNATNSPAPASFRQLLLRTLPTLATIAGVVLFVAAGHWQQGRMQEKEAQRAQQEAAAQSPPHRACRAADPIRLDGAALSPRPRDRNV